MKQMILILFLVLQGCGKASSPSPIIGVDLPDSECQVDDACTYADVSGYQCKAARVDNPTSCLIEKEDYETDPSCNPASPNGTCEDGGWGTPVVIISCCETVQGPGPAAH